MKKYHWLLTRSYNLRFGTYSAAFFLAVCCFSRVASGQTLYEASDGTFQEIGPTTIVIDDGATVEIFGYVGQATTIRGAGPGSSTLSGFTVTTAGNGSDTPLFLYNPANETVSGAAGSLTAYGVSVSNLTVTNGLSQGGSAMYGGGGAGLGGGAFVGAGVTLTLTNVNITGNTATGGSDGDGGYTSGGGLGGNSSGLNAQGGLFANGIAGSGPAQGYSGGFGEGGDVMSPAGFGGGGNYGEGKGFGGGDGEDGGSGLGGGIFVQNGGSVLITGNSAISGNTVNAGTGLAGVGTNGQAAGADIFMMSGSSVTLAPGVNNTITIGSAADDAAGQVSDVADDSAYGMTGGTGTGAMLTIGNSSAAGGTVVLHGNNTYAGGTSISDSTTLEIFQDDNLGAATGGIAFFSGGELLTDSTATGGFITSRDISLNGNGTLAAVTGTSATYEGTLSGSGSLNLGDGTNTGTVDVQAGAGFAEITPSSIAILPNTTAGLFGYVGQATTIRGAGPGSSTLSGFTVTTAGNGSDTPLFLYNPANETVSGAAGSLTAYGVSVSNLTVTNGLSQGGSAMYGGGGAGLGGGAFVGAGVTLTLTNVNITGNTATGGSDGDGGYTSGGGLGGNSSGLNAQGGLFANGIAGSGPAQGYSGGFGEGGDVMSPAGFGGGGNYGEGKGFGGGDGEDGGSGLGGGIFVQNGGSVLITGNSAISGNTVNAGTGLAGVGTNGQAAGADIFMMSGSSVTLAPGVNNTITIGSAADDAAGQVSDVADDSAYGMTGGTGTGAMLTIGNSSAAGGTVVLHGNNTYAGGTSISDSTTLEIFQDSNLGAFDSTNPAIGTVTLSNGGGLLTDSAVPGGFTTARTISISDLNSLSATSGTTATYNGMISGHGGLSVGGYNNSGTVNLTAANTYTQTTTVISGYLNANNTSGSATGSGPVVVEAGGTLGGTGTIAVSGANNINIVGGALSPSDGSGAASHLTFALSSGAQVNVESGSTFVFDLGATTATSDEILVTGGQMTLSNQVFGNFTFNAETAFGAGTYILVDSADGITGSLGSTVTGLVDNGDYNATLLLTDPNEGGSDQDLELVVVAAPEPSVWMMIIGGLLVLGVRARRKSPSFRTHQGRARRPLAAAFPFFAFAKCASEGMRVE